MARAQTPEVALADAREDDVPFLAWVLQAASLSHLQQSTFDVFVDNVEHARRQLLEGLASTEVRQWSNYRRFIVARSGDQPVGALCGYFLEECDGPLFGKSTIDVVTRMGWSHDDLVAAWNRIKPVSRVLLDREPGAWIVESVAVLPEFRRMGILTRLMSSILERGRGRGATTAEISVLIGNDSAQRAYEKAGFVVAAEARDADYEATFGCPGVRLLRMAL
jgi:ribosomal protein S18 acetylase RimI-like enzyme